MRGFLFGKLPAFGDFVCRGLTAPMRIWWDDWCMASMQTSEGQIQSGPRLQRRRSFINAPPFVGAPWQIVSVQPSHDRVGRPFPFVIGLSLTGPPCDREALRLHPHLLACADLAGETRCDLDTLIQTVEAAAAVRDHRPSHAEGMESGNVPCGED